MDKSRRFRYLSLMLAGLTALIIGSVTIQVDGKPVTAQITFKVEAGRLSGHVSSTMSGEQDFVGTVEGAAFEFGFGGDAGQIMFKGTADTATTLKGTFDNPGTGGEGPFTAKRKE